MVGPATRGRLRNRKSAVNQSLMVSVLPLLLLPLIQLPPDSAMADAPLKRTHGYLAEFGSVAELFHAAEKCRDAGFRFWDTHSPFPIHGMDDAMGIKKSILSLFVLIGGCTGATVAILLQFGTQVGLYPTVVQGKPTNLFTLPAYFPISFELTVLFSALGQGLAQAGADKAKQAKLDANPHDMDASELPDALVSVEKQRNGSFEGKLKMWFAANSFRFSDSRTCPVEPYVLQGAAA